MRLIERTERGLTFRGPAAILVIPIWATLLTAALLLAIVGGIAWCAARFAESVYALGKAATTDRRK